MADAGTVTIVENNSQSQTIRKVVFTWTSSAGGAADKQTVGAYVGEVLRATTIPATGGSQPTSYAITLLDDDGVDVLAGNGTTRSTTVTEQLAESSLGVVSRSKLYLHVTNAGNAKGGTFIAYLR